ncbi:MAG: ABC transporter ATP-binding protein [bacterium]|nr:ABC transporter ATP-binding protein [bacterium]
MSAPAVLFEGVSKRFRRGSGHDTLASLLASGVRRLVHPGGAPQRDDTFWALEDVSFEVQPGHALGIVGPNGAGKSTILKVLAGIMRPDAGQVRVRGRVTALIEVGAGFHPDLSGRENIFLAGAILGMTRPEIRSKMDAIIDFAGVGPFIDTPVKRYSTGMQARLGFSIAAHVSPDVLLVDEVLSVGDAVFRVRCLERMSELVRSGLTLIFVSHNLEQVRQICPQTVVLQESRVAFDGPTGPAIEKYIDVLMRSRHRYRADVCGSAYHQTSGSKAPTARIEGVRFLDGTGRSCQSITPTQQLDIEVRYELAHPIRRMVLELNMLRDFSQPMLSLNSLRDEVEFSADAGDGRALVRLPRLPVSGGQYFWNVRIWDADHGTIEVDTPFDYPLIVDDGGRAAGLLCIDRTWSAGEPPEPTPNEPVLATMGT